MNARFFYADQSHNTWPKLFVLTQDGTLYCEYLDYMKPATINKTVDFTNFTASDYSFGGYQTMEEISYDKARTAYLKQQQNWVDRYLTTKGLK